MDEEENFAEKPVELCEEEIKDNKERGELLHNILRGPSRWLGNFPDACVS